MSTTYYEDTYYLHHLNLKEHIGLLINHKYYVKMYVNLHINQIIKIV